MNETKKSFLNYRDILSKAYSRGYIHFLIAKKIQSEFLRGLTIYKVSPTYWFFSYGAHSECAFSYLIRIIEKRDKLNPDNLTIHKYLNLIEQNYRSLFIKDKWEVIRKEIKNDKLLVDKNNKIIDKLMAIRDKFLSHFDKAFLRKNLFSNYEIENDEINFLYLFIEQILNKYSLLFDGTKNPYELSSFKITLDMDFKAFDK
jgi:hypothetical protein